MSPYQSSFFDIITIVLDEIMEKVLVTLHENSPAKRLILPYRAKMQLLPTDVICLLRRYYSASSRETGKSRMGSCRYDTGESGEVVNPTPTAG
jgi:hypothetical protein